MTPAASQALVAAAVGITILIIVVKLARKRKLSLRYTIGWLALSFTGLLAGLFVPIVEPLAQLLNLSAAALLGLFASVLCMAIALQLSVSISKLQRENETLSEHLARLNQKFDSAFSELE